MNPRFAISAFVVSTCFAFVGHANKYNDWAQKNAVNLNGPSASEAAQIDIVPRNDSEAIALAAGNSMRSKKNIETALRNNATALPRPSVGLISSAEVSGYPYVDRYLTELGDKDITHYYILREDYTFQDLSGESVTIPAGFIWDGASIPTGLFGKAIELTLEVGNTRYNSALPEGLIHDYMYRNPRRFSQEDADDLLYVNLVRCGNADPKKIYKGVQVFGGDSYQGHKRRQDQGLYDVFTTEFYNKNTAIFQSCRISHKPEVFDRDSQSKKKDPLGEKVCHTDSVSVNELKATDAADAKSENLPGEVGVRGWCKCPGRSAHITMGNLHRMGEDFKIADYSYFFCSECYRCRRDLDDVACLNNDGPIRIWDVKVARANGFYGKGHLDGDTEKLLVDAQEKIFKIQDGEVVIPGLCRCESPRIWLFGESPNRIEMCKDCGRPRSPIPLSAKNPRQPRKLRRCRKTPTSIFVCTCAGDTGVKPKIHASPYDDGDVELSLECTKCSQVKYSAFAPVREFKKKFANGKPDPQAMLVYMIGTADIKAAMLAADKEALSQK